MQLTYGELSKRIRQALDSGEGVRYTEEQEFIKKCLDIKDDELITYCALADDDNCERISIDTKYAMVLGDDGEHVYYLKDKRHVLTVFVPSRAEWCDITEVEDDQLWSRIFDVVDAAI